MLFLPVYWRKCSDLETMSRVKMLGAVRTIFHFPPSIVLVRIDMDVNEHKRLFNITCRDNSAFIAVLHFCHSRVFNHEQNPYPKISVKRSLAILYTFIDKPYISASLSFFCYLYLFMWHMYHTSFFQRIFSKN